jgi:hypothetical protein
VDDQRVAALLLLYCCFTAALLLLYCCFTAALLLLEGMAACGRSEGGCFTAALLLLYCCFTAALLLLEGMAACGRTLPNTHTHKTLPNTHTHKTLPNTERVLISGVADGGSRHSRGWQIYCCFTAALLLLYFCFTAL